MTAPLISYIVPSYNVPAQMLTACIDSILKVDLRPDEREIIVVDDGSATPCADVLKGYSDALTIIRQNNQGLSVARNTGIEQAKGTYIHFVDADDMLIHQPYTECVNALKAAGEEIDVLAFTFTTDLKKQCTAPLRTYDTGANYMQANNLRPAACCYIFRRSLLGDLRFVPKLKNEDERFTTLLFIKAGRTLITASTAYYYRQREGSLQHSYDEGFVSKRLDDYASTMLLFNRMTFQDKSQQLAMQRRIRQMVMDYIYNIICLTRSKTQLDRAIEMLTANGLFPMAHVRYTNKYLIFSFLANNALGRFMLLKLLPALPKEI